MKQTTQTSRAEEKTKSILYWEFNQELGDVLREREARQKIFIENFKLEYCSSCKKYQKNCKPLFDLEGNCWGYAS